MIVGADRPDGSVDGDKARVDGLLVRGDVPRPRVQAGGQKMRDTVPITSRTPTRGEESRARCESTTCGRATR